MEEIKELIMDAEKKLTNVDHLLSVTFPLVQDSRILAPIAETLAQSALKTMEALLKYEYAYKRILELPNNIDGMYNLFRSKVALRYKMNKNLLIMLFDLKNILQFRKRSAAEFVKHEKYIICSDVYSTTVITSEKLKSYKDLIAQFINQVKEIISRRS